MHWLFGRALTSVGAVGIGVSYLVLTYPPTPLPPVARSNEAMLVTREQIPSLIFTKLPRYTGGMFGHRQEPINLIFVGTQSDIESAFGAAGWVKAAPLTWSTFLQAARATLTHSADAAGPVTPSFLGEMPQSLAFRLKQF